MTNLDRLSDTVYREQAIGQLDDLLGARGTIPVQKTQIYGLRQIARQEPGKVGEFARHQRGRAERKQEQASGKSDLKLKNEIDFWDLVDRLCDSSSPWSVLTEGLEHAPAELRDENIPARNKGMTPRRAHAPQPDQGATTRMAGAMDQRSRAGVLRALLHPRAVPSGDVSQDKRGEQPMRIES